MFTLPVKLGDVPESRVAAAVVTLSVLALPAMVRLPVLALLSTYAAPVVLAMMLVVLLPVFMYAFDCPIAPPPVVIAIVGALIALALLPFVIVPVPVAVR